MENMSDAIGNNREDNNQKGIGTDTYKLEAEFNKNWKG